MSFQSITGQDRAARMLQNGLLRRKVSHAYIFSGPLGTGRRQMALTFAKAIFCTEQNGDACNVCLECRKADNSNHSNLHWVSPEGSAIKIDQIRRLQKDFSYKATSSYSKVYIITEAERLTPQAANSLLKFLEEPLPDIVAILITENGQALLPTIRSRAQWVPFVPVARPRLIGALVSEGISEALAHPAVHLTAGVEAARELIQLNWFAEIRNVMIQLARESLAANTAVLITAQQKIVKTELSDHIGTLFDLFVLFYKDMIQHQVGRNEHLVFIDQTDWMRKHAVAKDSSFWVKCMEQAAEARKRLRFNVNPQLTLEQFLIGIR
jgi:DNA polymerase-3 subunit delta'